MDKSQTQVNRHWKLIRLLSESPEGLPLKTLAERLGVTPRTVNRDLATLQQAGVPLRERTEAHGLKYWKLTEKNPGGPSTFSYDEAAALYLGRRFLEPLMRTFLWDAADSAFKKIRDQLGSQAVRHLDRLLQVFRTTNTVNKRYIDKSSLIDALIIGCEDCREVVISYRSYSADADETYTIRPYEMEISDDTIYVAGFSCKSKTTRLWKLDRMSSALVTETKFVKPEHFESIAFASSDTPPQKVCIVFDSTIARFVREHRWHKSEQLTDRPDGSVLAEYELRETVFIKNRLLSYGHHAEVLEPLSLRAEIRKEIELMRQRYDD